MSLPITWSARRTRREPASPRYRGSGLGPADWDLQIDINLKSVFLVCTHVLPVMEAEGGGAIVNVASTSGISWTGAAQVAHAASKAGVIQLSRVVPMQSASKGRVNTVAPGQMHTPMVEARFITGTELVVDGGMTARCG